MTTAWGHWGGGGVPEPASSCCQLPQSTWPMPYNSFPGPHRLCPVVPVRPPYRTARAERAHGELGWKGGEGGGLKDGGRALTDEGLFSYCEKLQRMVEITEHSSIAVSTWSSIISCISHEKEWLTAELLAVKIPLYTVSQFDLWRWTGRHSFSPEFSRLPAKSAKPGVSSCPMESAVSLGNDVYRGWLACWNGLASCLHVGAGAQMQAELGTKSLFRYSLPIFVTRY